MKIGMISVADKIKFLTEDAYKDLIYSFDGKDASFIRQYDQDFPWLDEYFKQKDFYVESSAGVCLPSLNCPIDLSSEEKSQNDLTNIRIFYTALKDMTPLQAQNKYMWTYLAHDTYYEYAVHRWRSGNESFINNRMIMRDTSPITLRRHSLARLWWFGYSTYDEEHENTNPFKYTELLFRRGQQACYDLVERNYSRDKFVTMGILRGLEQVLNDGIPENYVTANVLRETAHNFNKKAAVGSLNLMGVDDIQKMSYDMIFEEMKRQSTLK